MTQEHPITPPPELFNQWEDDILNERDNVDHVLDCAWRNGFQAGADQQLEKDAKWLDHNALSESHLKVIPVGDSLKEAMRPKPPSLKQQALKALQRAEEGWRPIPDDCDTIRRALESLPDQ
jgi:hypothetical protein